MKLNPQQLQQASKNSAIRLFVLHGDEPYLLAQYAEQITQQLTHLHKENELERLSIENNADWQHLSEKTQSYSLFASYQIFNAQFNKASLDTGAKQTLIDLLSGNSEDFTVILTAPKLKNLTALKKFDKHIGQIQAWPLKGNQLIGWVRQQFANKHLSTDANAYQLIADLNEGNLLACAQTVEKLTIQFESGFVPFDKLQQTLSMEAQYDIFKLADAALAGNKKIEQILKQLKASGTEPTLVLWSLCKEIRLLCKLHWSLSNNQNLNNAMGQCNIWDSKKPLYQQAVKRTTLKQCYQLLKLAKQIDETIKGSKHFPVWVGLSKLSMHLAGSSQSCHA